ncbi:hypothetical protein Q5Y75_12025 [Ruegeria sp. 2205SS24-7]|uniref:hypothetical protein n=1 Tax=Ruegeria discodermiae TaxID=3064389 RepID=UPI0027421F2C|nr:hypothetical protein [Ruegeria sp. 2205SS24-7]MDP5217948.1 hypothetical protein [Ruegeria sp. 2205SS24-7]
MRHILIASALVLTACAAPDAGVSNRTLPRAMQPGGPASIIGQDPPALITPVAAPASLAASGTTRRLSANETVTVTRTGPNTVVETYRYGSGPQTTSPAATTAALQTPDGTSRVPVYQLAPLPSTPYLNRKMDRVIKAARKTSGVPVSTGEYSGTLRRLDFGTTSYAVYDPVTLGLKGTFNPRKAVVDLAQLARVQTGCTGAERGDAALGNSGAFNKALVVPISCTR